MVQLIAHPLTHALSPLKRSLAGPLADSNVTALQLDGAMLAWIVRAISVSSGRSQYGLVRAGGGVRQWHLRPAQARSIAKALFQGARIRRAVRRCAGLLSRDDVSRCRATAWLNVARPGDFHDWHRHTGAHLSFVLFFENLPAMHGGRLEFRKQGAGSGPTVSPRAGLLLIFPSTLEHRTRTLRRGRRRSLAIDFHWSVP